MKMSSYTTVEKALNKYFGRKENHKNVKVAAVWASLEFLNLNILLHGISSILRCADFNDLAQLELFRQAVIMFPNLAQLDLYLGDNSLKGL